MPAPTVAVVILNWNGRKFLEQFLPSVTASGYQPCTIYVADNASTDDSLDYLKANWPQVKIISLPENYGFTKGYNEALRQVQADYYVLLNSDVEVEAGWLEPMVRLLESDHTIGACQPRIRSYHQRDHFEYAGAAGGWIDRYGYPFCRGRVFEQLEADTGQYNDTVPIFWPAGQPCLYVLPYFMSCVGLILISLPIRRRLIFAGGCNWQGIVYTFALIQLYIM